MWICTTYHGSLCDSLQGVNYHGDQHVLDGCSLSNEFSLAFGSPRAANSVIDCSTGNRSREGPSRCSGVLVGCQGKSLTVTSACDLGVMCHVGLFLVHAVTAKVWPSPNRLTHAPDSFVPFRRSARLTTVEIWRVFYAPPGVG